MTVCICFNYGGKLEISDAVNRALEKGEKITQKLSNKTFITQKFQPAI